MHLWDLDSCILNPFEQVRKDNLKIKKKDKITVPRALSKNSRPYILVVSLLIECHAKLASFLVFWPRGREKYLYFILLTLLYCLNFPSFSQLQPHNIIFLRLYHHHHMTFKHIHFFFQLIDVLFYSIMKYILSFSLLNSLSLCITIIIRPSPFFLFIFISYTNVCRPSHISRTHSQFGFNISNNWKLQYVGGVYLYLLFILTVTMNF